MIDVRRVRVFHEVARRGSFAAAAEALAFTPSAVSQQVAALEREMGVALVQRGPSSIRLTEAGRVLVARTEEVLARLVAAEEEVRAVAGLTTRMLRVASFATAAAALLPRAMELFSERNRHVEMTLLESDPQLSMPLVRCGELDLALVWEYDHVPVPTDDTVERVLLLDDPVQLIVSREHELARRHRIDLSQMAGEVWITTTRRSSCNPFLRRACQAAGFEPKIAAQADDHHALQRLVAAGVGVALETRMSVVAPHPDIAVCDLSASLKRRVLVAFRAGEGDVPRIADAVAALRQAASEYDAARAPADVRTLRLPRRRAARAARSTTRSR